MTITGKPDFRWDYIYLCMDQNLNYAIIMQKLYKSLGITNAVIIWCNRYVIFFCAWTKTYAIIMQKIIQKCIINVIIWCNRNAIFFSLHLRLNKTGVAPGCLFRVSKILRCPICPEKNHSAPSRSKLCHNYHRGRVIPTSQLTGKNNKQNERLQAKLWGGGATVLPPPPPPMVPPPEITCLHCIFARRLN